MPQVLASELIDKLIAALACPQYKVARLMGLDPHTLSNVRDQRVAELTPRTRTRLATLFQVVRTLGPLPSDALLDILQRHVFEDEAGRRDSVASALQQEKYPLEVLFQIADTARREFSAQWVSAMPDLTDAISLSA